jgi:hypothetical protein
VNQRRVHRYPWQYNLFQDWGDSEKISYN